MKSGVGEGADKDAAMGMGGMKQFVANSARRSTILNCLGLDTKQPFTLSAILSCLSKSIAACVAKVLIGLNCVLVD